MKKYYTSRGLIALALAVLMMVLGLVWWAAVLAGLLVFAGFVLLARSGRYTVQPEGGLAPMRRDEMSQEINQCAGLNGFVTLVFGMGGLTFYYGAVARSNVPTGLLGAVLALGLAAYILTDYRLRRM